MLETIQMIGLVLFVLSAPVAFAIGMYNTYHPESQKNMQEVFERHKKFSTILIIVYVLWAEMGVLWVISRLF